MNRPLEPEEVRRMFDADDLADANRQEAELERARRGSSCYSCGCPAGAFRIPPTSACVRATCRCHQGARTE